MKTYLASTFLLIALNGAHANLQVSLTEQRTTGDRTVLKLKLCHSFSRPIRSARAHVFLSRADGTVVGRGVRWIIGGDHGLGPLPPNHTTNYFFVVTTEGSYERVDFGCLRVVLEDGQVHMVGNGLQPLAP